MKLKGLHYCQYKGEDKEWTLDGLTLRDINLLVGRNASGKTKALNVIHALAKLLSGEKLTYVSGDYHYNVTFVLVVSHYFYAC